MARRLDLVYLASPIGEAIGNPRLLKWFSNDDRISFQSLLKESAPKGANAYTSGRSRLGAEEYHHFPISSGEVNPSLVPVQYYKINPKTRKCLESQTSKQK